MLLFMVVRSSCKHNNAFMLQLKTPLICYKANYCCSWSAKEVSHSKLCRHRALEELLCQASLSRSSTCALSQLFCEVVRLLEVALS